MLALIVVVFITLQATFVEIVSESLIDEVKDAVTNMVSSICVQYICIINF